MTRATAMAWGLDTPRPGRPGGGFLCGLSFFGALPGAAIVLTSDAVVDHLSDEQDAALRQVFDGA